MELKISLKLDNSFRMLAGKLPPMQIEVAGIRQTIKGKPLYVDHHAEILCHYAKGNLKGVKQYVKMVQEKLKQQKSREGMKVVK